MHTSTGAQRTHAFTPPPYPSPVRSTVPAGYTQSYPRADTPNTVDCTDPHAGRGWDVTLTSGSTDSGNDFGNFANGRKLGTKFDDLNGNGQRDPNEPGIEGVQIHLVGTDGLGNAVHEHTTTGANGNYAFSVPPGHYTACETVPAGYTQSYPRADTPNTVDCTDPHAGHSDRVD